MNIEIRLLAFGSYKSYKFRAGRFKCLYKSVIYFLSYICSACMVLFGNSLLSDCFLWQVSHVNSCERGAYMTVAYQSIPNPI